ncbi:MAG: ammonia-forming cytochrome c nitrite reductase subunit c552, partial [candidate division KSB1 bacterium]|nr:ammonia-forming cytochrome c nitrite reductase subunit c552 [candidate division KSB1 bacterium]
DGSNAIEYGIPIGSSGHKFAIADACVTCHMAETPAAGQPGHDKIGGHTFAMEADGVQNVAVCQQCHGPIKSFDDIMAKADYDEDGTIESTRHEIEGLLHKLDELLPPNSTTAEVNANYKWEASMTPAEIQRRQMLTKAWYNFRFVEEDRSMGVHNAGYAIALLRRSIATLTSGDIGAGKILSIKDIPQDQGKQVRVSWSKFAADAPAATNAVTSYSVWRRVDDPGNALGVKVGSRQEMLAAASTAKPGSRFTVNQFGTWDFVAWLPATGYEMYSVVAPTLYDSTAAGMHWSVFFVSGQARNVVYETAPDSGYSVDNLAPFAPGNVTASVVDRKVSLSWDDPVDADFQYFAIYRSTIPGFDPKGTTPIKTLTGTTYLDSEVTAGQNYYYRLSAFDFSGNESAFSAELPVSITGVDDHSGVPTVFALQQNYPNPFNPETSIQYHLPTPGHVRLVIYSSLGQQVRRLVDRFQPAAYHVVVWDGRDDAGNLLPSGVYFYRITAGNFTAMKKMVMMK